MNSSFLAKNGAGEELNFEIYTFRISKFWTKIECVLCSINFFSLYLRIAEAEIYIKSTDGTIKNSNFTTVAALSKWWGAGYVLSYMEQTLQTICVGPEEVQN